MADDSFHTEMLQRAIDLSKKAVQDPQLYAPYGAVVVRHSDRRVVGEGCNNVWEETDPSLHGEVVAIKRACKETGSRFLNGCSLYTSCEPCAMCAALIWWTQIDHVYYANIDTREEIRSLTALVSTPSDQRSNYSQMMGEEAEAVIKDWEKVKPAQ